MFFLTVHEKLMWNPFIFLVLHSNQHKFCFVKAPVWARHLSLWEEQVLHIQSLIDDRWWGSSMELCLWRHLLNEEKAHKSTEHLNPWKCCSIPVDSRAKVLWLTLTFAPSAPAKGEFPSEINTVLHIYSCTKAFKFNLEIIRLQIWIKPILLPFCYAWALMWFTLIK